MLRPQTITFALMLGIGVASTPALSATPPAAPDCGSADVAMATMMAGGSNAKSTGDVDKDFAASTLALQKSMLAMAKLEVRCGTDSRAKAAAKKFLEVPSSYFENLELIRHSG